jgi:hypothetical protein
MAPELPARFPEDLVVIAVIFIAVVAILGLWVLGLRKDRGLTEPLGRIAGLYGRALVLYLAAAALWLPSGFDSGGGPRGSVCVNTAYPYSANGDLGIVARASASVSAVGSIHACALHPSVMQWALYLLTRVPDIVLWGVLLLLIWRLISRASHGGPFTARVAITMQQLGWVVIGGTMIAGVLGGLGTDLLTRMLMTPATYSGGGIASDVLVFTPLKALLPVPAIAGAALLSFARIIRAGAVLDEEIKATV